MNLINKIFFISLIALLACSEKKPSNKISVQNLVIDNSISSLNDSIYFSSVKDIEVDNKLIYLTDFVQNRVLVLDFELQLINYFGAEGKGPSDFSGSMNLKVKNDLIYVADDGARSFKVFDKEYVHVKNIPFYSKIIPHTEFDIDNQLNIYQHTRRKEITSKISHNGTNQGSIGDFMNQFPLETIDRSNEQTNSWHITLSNDTIVAVNQCEPIILMYSVSNNRLINTYDLSNINQLKNRLEYVNKKFDQDPFNPSSYILISDIVLRDKSLFILITGYNKSTKNTRSNEILEIELLRDNKFNVLNHFNLNSNGWYKCFNFVDEQILTYNNATESLEIYTIPKE